MNFWPFKKQPLKKTWIASAKGHYPLGLGCCEVYFNLYEDEKGKRSYDMYLGREFTIIPRKAIFSARAQVDAWAHSDGPLPRCLYDPFKDMETLK